MNTSPAPRWKIWLAAFALFAAGMAVGVVVTFGIGVHLVRQRLLSPAAHGFADRATARIETTLARELALNPDQAAQVHASLEKASSQMKGIRIDAVRDVRRTVRDTLADIRTRLTPEQAARLDRLVSDRLDRLGLTAPAATDSP